MSNVMMDRGGCGFIKSGRVAGPRDRQQARDEPWQGPREPWAEMVHGVTGPDGPVTPLWCYEWSQIASALPCDDRCRGIKVCRAAKVMNKGKVTGNPAAGPGPPMRWDPRCVYGWRRRDIKMRSKGYGWIVPAVLCTAWPFLRTPLQGTGGPSGQKSGVTGPRRGHPDDPGCIYRPLRSECMMSPYINMIYHVKYPERIVDHALVRPAGRSPQGGPQHPQAGVLL